jgi:hypothetical protein
MTKRQAPRSRKPHQRQTAITLRCLKNKTAAKKNIRAAAKRDISKAAKKEVKTEARATPKKKKQQEMKTMTLLFMNYKF